MKLKYYLVLLNLAGAGIQVPYALDGGLWNAFTCGFCLAGALLVGSFGPDE